MDYIVFGNTGLKVSVMGLGCGGPSRLGQQTDKTETESIAIIREALDAGVNFLDTAEAYGTEELVGKALQEVDRSNIIISTKKSYGDGISPDLLRRGLEDSLRRLRTDYVDIYELHGVLPSDYAGLRDELVPVFHQLRDEGKIRFMGVTELFSQDNTHRMLHAAVQDNVWDVVMVGFNILNQTARDRVFRLTQEQNVAVQSIFAVRRALSQPDKLVAALKRLIDEGQLDPEDIDLQHPLGFVLEESDATSLVDASYRFCRYEPGVHVVFSGTGNIEHLRSNIESLNRPPLPEEVVDKLRHLFRSSDAVTGE